MKEDTKTSMIRVNEKTHRLLKGLAGLNGMTISAMLERIVAYWNADHEGGYIHGKADKDGGK